MQFTYQIIKYFLYPRNRARNRGLAQENDEAWIKFGRINLESQENLWTIRNATAKTLLLEILERRRSSRLTGVLPRSLTKIDINANYWQMTSYTPTEFYFFISTLFRRSGMNIKPKECINYFEICYQCAEHKMEKFNWKLLGENKMHSVLEQI